MSTLISSDVAVVHFRMIQRSATEIEIRYVLRPGANADIGRLTAALRSAVDGKLESIFRCVDSIVEKKRTAEQRVLIRSAHLD